MQGLGRAELQAVAKENGVPANKKSSEIIKLLLGPRLDNAVAGSSFLMFLIAAKDAAALQVRRSSGMRVPCVRVCVCAGVFMNMPSCPFHLPSPSVLPCIIIVIFCMETEERERESARARERERERGRKRDQRGRVQAKETYYRGKRDLL